MAEFGFVISPYPSLTEDMVAKIYEAQAPLAEIDSITIPERNGAGVPTPGVGHQVQYADSFTGLDNIPHIFRLYTDSGSLLIEYNMQPGVNVVTLYTPHDFVIGDGGTLTPAAGSHDYANVDFAGATQAQLRVAREGVQFYDWVVDPGGGFTLSNGSDEFRTGERWTVERRPSVVNNPVNDSVVAKGFGGFVTVANTTKNYAASDLRKLIRLSGSSGKYYFLNTSQVPIGYLHTFSNQVGGTAIIYFQNGALIQPGGNVTEYNLGSGQIATFTYDGTNWNMVAQSAQVSAAEYISARGTLAVGEISFNKELTVSVTNQGTTNYTVHGAIRSVNSANAINDCTVIWSIKTKTATSFTVIFREEVPVNQNVYFDWTIIKTA